MRKSRVKMTKSVRRYAAIDQGTSSTRIITFDEFSDYSQLCTGLGIKHEQITPKRGWVEHNPLEILGNIKRCLLSVNSIDALGLCHQGESVVAWDGATGRPIYNAIVWQDQRTEAALHQLKKDNLEPLVIARTGLPLDPYFSASKIGWIIENAPEAKTLLSKGRLRVGTMDSFFMDHLCGSFLTDFNSASRTSLFNIHTMTWDPELCEIFGVPIQCLPEIRSNIGEFGIVHGGLKPLPLTACIVDQFAGVYGHGCREPGDTKITFGTGAFIQSLTSEKVLDQKKTGLLPTLCWKLPNENPMFGLDGGVYNAASAVDWAKGLGLFESYDELENFGSEYAIHKGVAFVPALSGLACPYWDRSAAGLWAGLSLEVDKKDLLQSILEGVAVRAAEVIQAMEEAVSLGNSISIDGGLSNNNYFKQFLANILSKTIKTPSNKEITGLGTILLARRGCGENRISEVLRQDEIIEPNNDYSDDVIGLYKSIIQKSRGLRRT